MDYLNLTQTLVDSFNALADEVQSLTDRKTVLEHKLRYAHEQVSHPQLLSHLWRPRPRLRVVPPSMMISFSSRSRSAHAAGQD